MAKSSVKKRRASRATPASAPAPAPEPATASPQSPRERMLLGLKAGLIAIAVFWIYWPVLNGDWLWDDSYLITDNAVVNDPGGLRRIWLEPSCMADYQPLKYSVVWLQWHLLGDNTLGYHLTNVALHISSALLLWLLLSKLRFRFAWLGGLIFAIHPVQVESVAWISELKNTLSLPPFLWSMCAFIDYDEHKRGRDYFLALGLFLLAMLCKTTMVLFPLVIPLYAWWKRDRIGWNDVRDSAPFFAISGLLGLVTIAFQQHHSDFGAVPETGLLARLALAGQTISFYVSDYLWPVGLLLIYPAWKIVPLSLLYAAPLLLLGALAWWCWAKRTTWGRDVLFGLAFTLINLGPVIGFILGSYPNLVWSLDHLFYLPLVGLIGFTVAALGRIEQGLPVIGRRLGAAIVAGLALLLTWESRGYANLFVHAETLYAYTLEHNPGAYSAETNLGKIRAQQGRIPEAIDLFRKALLIRPDFFELQNNLGNALLKTGNTAEAVEHYRQALAINPGSAEAHNNLGDAFQKLDRISDAVDQYQQALRLNPDLAQAHNNLGNALLKEGESAVAQEQYEEAVKLAPNSSEIRDNLANILLKQGEASEAMDEFARAVQRDPKDPKAHYLLGNALLRNKQIADAIEQFSQSLKIDPKNADAHNSLGIALYASGKKGEAIAEFQAAIQIDPKDTSARNNLARAQGLQK